jgi:alpha-tubulin suppressor-like RCC1 family protein
MITLDRHTRLALAAVLLAATGGCQDDSPLPTDPVQPPGPALATSAAGTPLVFRFVSAGDSHTCGVTTDGRAYCWGNNFTGQLGDGTRTDHILPAPVLGGLRFGNVSVGRDHTCALTRDHRAYCWGYGGGGRLGDGSNGTITREPVAVAGGLRFAQVKAGSSHSCGITAAGEAYCWGDNQFGQLGDHTRIRRLTPARVTTNLRWRWVNPGGYHTCGVTTDNRAYCFGRNN